MSAPFQIAVGANEGNVILDIHDSDKEVRTYVPIQPSQAVAIAKSMIDAAVDCGADVRIEIPRAVVTEAQRVRLINRVSIMATSLVRDKATPGKMALEIVDTVLKEIA